MTWKPIFRSALLLALSAGATSTFCAADTRTFTATMTGPQETPPNASTASGFATVTLNGNLLTVNESFSGLSGIATGAHIHCCALPGVSAPIAVPFPMPPFPISTSGTFLDTFDLSTFSFTGGFRSAAGASGGFGGAVGGTGGGIFAAAAGVNFTVGGGSAVGASPIPRDVLSNTAAATMSVAVAAAIGMWLSSHTTANH